MRASDLMHSLSFEAEVITTDEYGGETRSWEPQFVTRGHIRYLRGGEVVQAARLVGKQPVVITIRSFADAKLVDTDWVASDTRQQVKYNINSIVPSDDRRFIEITATSGGSI